MSDIFVGVAVAIAAVTSTGVWVRSTARRPAPAVRTLLVLASATWAATAVVAMVTTGDPPLAGGLAVFAATVAGAAVLRHLAEAIVFEDSAVAVTTALVLVSLTAPDGTGPALVVGAAFIGFVALVVGTTKEATPLPLGVAFAAIGSAGSAGVLDLPLGHVAGLTQVLGLLLVAAAAVPHRRLTGRSVIALRLLAAVSVPFAVTAYGSPDPVALVAGSALIAAVVFRGSLDKPADDAGAVDEIAQLRRQEQLFRSLVADSSDIVMLIDPSGIVEYLNRAAVSLLRLEPGEAIGRPVEALVHPEDRPILLGLLDPARLQERRGISVDLRFARSDGGWCQTETTVNNHLANEAVRGLALTSRDIGDRKDLEEQLVVRAFHDSLTGLGNRALFRDRLEHAVARARRYRTGLAVMFLDLDGFKLVNDTLGHDVGDRLLVEVAHRLAGNLRAVDTVSRMGGDEFAILLEHPADVSSAPMVAGRILASLQTPIFVDSFPIKVSCSIGLDTTGGKSASSAEDLLRNADLAMYRAKALGKNQVARYEPNMRDEALMRVRLEKELRRAIDQDELVLHYQPVGSITSGEITGVEALIRWQHPERGMVPPSEFVSVAEESGLIVELGRWALSKACEQMAEVSRAAGRNDFWVSVNVATRQLLQPGLVQSVRGALNRSGLAPDRLVLEITEGALLDDPKAAASLLHQLRGLGVRLAIDDFGTGYSSLSRLRTFAVDKLKIDRSFVEEITAAHDRAPIVAAVMAMAHSLGLTAVAEGVETPEQLACLHRHGCEEVQGFLLSRPLPVDKLDEVMRRTGDLLDAAGVPPRSVVAESSLSALVREAAETGGGRPDVVSLLLTELSRQLGAACAFLARVDRNSGAEVVLVSSTAGAVDVPSGLVVASDAVGAFRTVVGGEVPSVLHHRGVESLTVVPIVDDEDSPSRLVLAVGTGTPSVLASHHVVLIELLTRLLADIALEPAAPARVEAPKAHATI